MEGSVLSFLRAEWKVSDTGSAQCWASSFCMWYIVSIIILLLLYLCVGFSYMGFLLFIINYKKLLTFCVGFSYMGFLLFIIKGYWPFVCGIFIYGFLLLSIKGYWPNFQYLMIFLVCRLGRRENLSHLGFLTQQTRTFHIFGSAGILSHFWFADSADGNLVLFLVIIEVIYLYLMCIRF
jgi:hypothetical protein